MPPNEATPAFDRNLLAALADAETLRHDLTSAEELLKAERRYAGDLRREVEALTHRLANADERQREVHVLLLHRDQEIARLHEYLGEAQARHSERALPGPGIEPRAPLPAASPPVSPVLKPVRSELAAAFVSAVDWWYRFSVLPVVPPTTRARSRSDTIPRDRGTA